VVTELVEASKRSQEKANEGGGFDRLNHHGYQRAGARRALADTELVEVSAVRKSPMVVSTGSTIKVSFNKFLTNS